MAVREDAPPAVRAFQHRMRNVASEPKGQTAFQPAKAAGVLSRPFRLIPVTGWKRGCLGAMPDSEQRWYRG